MGELRDSKYPVALHNFQIIRFAKVSRQLLALAEIKSSSRILDIATGIGEPAITAANQIGNSGQVT